MDERLQQLAAAANDLAYADEKSLERYIDGAPHIKHASLRELYSQLVLDAFDTAKRNSPVPKVLDLGAGEGSVTLPFLMLGGAVTAVDISSGQLERLRKKCQAHADRLQIRCEDISKVLADTSSKYDIIAANSFLHHIPDYVALIDQSLNLLTPHGLFFSFQDPLRYDSTGRFTRWFTDGAYFFWRLSRGVEGDVIGGIRRRMRRRRGVYLDDSLPDNVEYHVVRNGVNQDAIRQLFESRGFSCRIIPYFSSQNGLFQPIGEALKLHNMFGVIASRD